MAYLDEVAAKEGPDSDDPRPVYDLIQEHAVGRFLQGHGYRYVTHRELVRGRPRPSGSPTSTPVMPGNSDFGELLDSTTLSSTIDILRGVPPGHQRLHRAAALFGLDRVRAGALGARDPSS